MTTFRIWRYVLACCFSVLFLSFCKNEKKQVPLAQQQLNQDPQLTKLTQMLAEDPKNDTLLYLRAALYHQLDGFDEALNDLSAAIQLDSMQPAYYHLLADVLIDYGRPNDSKRALEVLKMAKNKFPGRIGTLLKLSEFQLIVRQHNDALTTLNEILQKDPENAEAFYMSGRVALDKGDTTNAVGALRKAVKIDATNTDAWMFLGKIFSNKKNPLAIQYFDNALRMDSTNLEAREFKAVYYKRVGEFAKAFDVYTEIIARNPDYSNAYFDMAMMYLELDSFPQARNNFDLAIKTDPLFVKAYYYRGVCSEQQGNLQAALADYVQANRMSPDYPEAKEARARLEKK
jgi:tetratricopeptide (TPR) repeat protein